jgi:hypothetical protein
MGRRMLALDGRMVPDLTATFLMIAESFLTDWRRQNYQHSAINMANYSSRFLALGVGKTVVIVPA